jgi:hypothetical protein
MTTAASSGRAAWHLPKGSVGYAVRGRGVGNRPSFAFVQGGGCRFDQVPGERQARAFPDGAGVAAIGATAGSAIRPTGRGRCAAPCSPSGQVENTLHHL